ncbi:MAG: hypothetical protein HQL74_13230 [Magnetococcales bacterium]|nr:hypothetical protein [Magnetococcales bacterium]
MAHVLVVDDDMSVRAFVLEILEEEEGHSVEEVLRCTPADMTSLQASWHGRLP